MCFSRTIHNTMRYNTTLLLFTPLIITLLLLPRLASADSQKVVIGWIETVKIIDTQQEFKAKIDTGADNSSIDASILNEYVRNADNWIRFQLTNNSGKSVILDKRVERYVKVKRREVESVKRPVVILNLCLGSTLRQVEVNLAKRKNFKYRMLIGRNYLHGAFLVDTSIKHASKPKCH